MQYNTYNISVAGSIPAGTSVNPLKLQSTLVFPHKHFAGHVTSAAIQLIQIIQ